MKLRVDDITAEARELAFAEPEAEINRELSRGPIAEYFLTRPVAIEISHYRAGTEVFLSGTVTAEARANCARCAEEFTATHNRPFRYVLAPKAIASDDDKDLRDEDLEFSLYDSDHVELTPLVREQVLLALTERPLCREDCLGLCPRCGVNRNEAACNCPSEAGYTRLAVLRTLKVGRG
jgi:uncharacterized protein